MADALVSALAQTILGNLNSVVVQEIGLVLQDAELKQRKSEAIQNWLTKLKNAAYDADNVLDEIATEGLRRRANSERGMQHQLKSFLSSRNPLLFRSKMAHKVKNVREKLDSIAKERLQFHLSEGVVENRFGVTSESRQTNSLVNESEIYGREEEKEMILKKIVGSGSEQDDLSVYAIWGMGGLGKTTLAKLVYNDARIEKHFELRIWVCVSDDFSTQRLLRAIIQSTGGGGSDISELDPLSCLLQDKLRGRKFLLVLDDVWNEKRNLWDELRQVLGCGSKGSMLMVTTRNEKVAITMATMDPYKIGNLSEDDSWSLFKQRTFKIEEVDENLVAMGKVIVKKCGGVPLAIKALGSLMRFKSDESEWLAIKESEIWHLRDGENCILPALRLSYDNLMPHMRQCFAYCCIFPKDYKMEENELVQLWMANGFIPSEGQTDLHLAGHSIFKELVWRSFLQDVQINSSGKRTCKMHDLMHDLALFVMKHETYILENSEVPEYPKMLRHLGLDLLSSWAIFENENKLKLSMDDSLRSLIVHDEGGIHYGAPQGFLSFLSKQQYLRVLVMNNHTILGLQNLAYKLVHLRNLSMSCSCLKELPESLTCLHNLQTLKLTSTWDLLKLPKRLKVLKNLWFLEMDEFDSLLCTPPGLGDLNCLRRLSVFIVGRDASHQINQLKELNLEGNLSIQGLRNVRSLEDAKSANLMTKRNLTSLSLSWKKGINKNSLECFEEVLEGLQPHENLEKMCISSYQGSRFPNWMSTLAFKHLKEISLEYCERCEHPLPLGKLPSLTRLTLKGMDSVKHLGAEWYGNGERSFPALSSLIISEMRNLEEWNVPDSVESFPCLKYLSIRECPKLTKLPFLPTLKEFSLHTSSVTLLGSIMFLEMLYIKELPIRTLPKVLDNPSTLKTLWLHGCANLESVEEGLQYLTSLEKLVISHCDSITSFPAAILENMSSLISLTFQRCKKLNPLSGPLQSGAVLEHLLISGCPELKHLPESVQKLSCLKELWIWYSKGIRSLPNWLGSLQSLTQLSIRGCPDLAKRCEKTNGEDWLTISHIPFLHILPGEHG
ncbi:hypothetical protein BUALT_Bualt18G0052200 [Buddleja alternifolia]|uniref:Disease resistance protein RGA3 n=1 Tax=Buddleja alternifolia TaxID=168488 RepID=A0AAV6W4J6_9LAMI|nr:hypothetical protein BUALT_Bualt18G0052200 [Buddleja alternifolia]